MVVSFFECRIETARKHILLDLTVPLVGGILLEPLRKAGKLVSRKTGHGCFDFLNAHGQKIRMNGENAIFDSIPEDAPEPQPKRL